MGNKVGKNAAVIGGHREMKWETKIIIGEIGEVEIVVIFTVNQRRPIRNEGICVLHVPVVTQTMIHIKNARPFNK
jgi:hypothetical protein